MHRSLIFKRQCPAAVILKVQTINFCQNNGYVSISKCITA